MSQIALLRHRRFAPMFWTQFLGAFNDNLFKNALMILVAYRSLSLGSLRSDTLVPLGAGLFILPFFLFSATAGQLADRYPKTTLMRWVKLVEILLMSIAALGFIHDSLPLLLTTLFLMGLQSTFFGPAKYSVLPELVRPAELTGSNALVELGTFLAILLGTVAGGVLIAIEPLGAGIVGGAVVLLALFGWISSQFLPSTTGANPHLAINLNPIIPLRQTLGATRSSRAVFLSILAISWFWFFGASLLTVLPSYGKEVLHANEHVVTLLLGLFCVGIAIGSLLCERLGGEQLELGLIPLGSIGMSLAALDLFFIGAPAALSGQHELLGLSGFLATPGSLRLSFDFLLLAICGGLNTVPLYTLIQQRAPAQIRSRVIAGNNILNALFMVVSAALLMGASAIGLTIPQVFGLLALLNAIVAIYIYTVVAEFLLRFVAWVVAHMLYRIRVTGRRNIPATGPAILVANHVSYIDWLLLCTTTQRPIRFVMHHAFMELPLVRFLLRDAKVIPIASVKEDPGTLAGAFDTIAESLEDGELVCLFPEGHLTPDGTQGPFRNGIERMVARTPVPVVPIALGGMWGSFFSRKDGKALRRPFRRFWSKVTLTIGASLPPTAVTASTVAQQVAALGGWPAAQTDRAEPPFALP